MRSNPDRIAVNAVHPELFGAIGAVECRLLPPVVPTSRQELAVFTKRHRRENRQIAILLRRQNGRLEFVHIAHRLDGDKVRPRFRTAGDLLGKHLVGRVKGEIAYGLEEAARGPHIKGDESFPRAGRPRILNGRRNDLRQ